jgi:DNA repair protein RecO (recombination protein O)
VPLYKTDAVVLRTYNVREADRIVILFSPLHGRIESIAKGIRKPASKFGGSLEVFSHVYVMLSEGKSLDVITQVDLRNAHYTLREDLKRLTCGGYFMELVEKAILSGQENIELFSLVLSGLSLLEYNDNLELVLCYIELHFLDILGFAPSLEHCQKCGVKFSSSYVKFRVSSGGGFCKSCSEHESSGYTLISIDTLNFMKCLRDIEAHEIGELNLSNKNYKELKILFRRLLLYHFAREIKSMKMLDSVFSS